MKRYDLYLKESKEETPLATLGVLHQDTKQIILTYYNLLDPESFARDMQLRCQQLQSYDLKEEHHSSQRQELNDYLILGINDVARMIYFIQQGDRAWLNDYKPKLLAPKSFYLNWDKKGGFNAEWQ